MTNKIIDQARTWIGTEFIHQGRSKKNEKYNGACDCIGLIVGVLKELDNPIYKYDVTNYSRLAVGKRLIEIMDNYFPEASELEEGLIGVFKFNNLPQHVGFISKLPDGRWGLIHCYQGANKVVEHELTKPWQNRLLKLYKVID